MRRLSIFAVAVSVLLCAFNARAVDVFSIPALAQLLAIEAKSYLHLGDLVTKTTTMVTHLGNEQLCLAPTASEQRSVSRPSEGMREMRMRRMKRMKRKK